MFLMELPNNSRKTMPMELLKDFSETFSKHVSKKLLKTFSSIFEVDARFPLLFAEVIIKKKSFKN